ncbi:MAG: HDIG domain-containing protein [Spirochaetota bacterium]|nr:MAG: HDIG domain-containing protein [Spirochaetota bacterium]
MIKIKLYQDKNAAIFYAVIAVLFALILWLIARPYFGVRYDYSIGDISTEDIVNPKDVTYVNVKETQKRIDEVKSRVPVIFDLNMSVKDEALRKVDQFYDLIEEINVSMPALEEKIAEVYNLDYHDLSEDNLEDTFQNFEELLYRERVKGAVENILNAGLSLYTREQLLEYRENGIILKRIHKAEITQHKVEIDTVFAEDEVEEATERYFSENFDDLDKKKIAFLVTQTGSYFTPNLFINEEESNLLKIEEVRKVEPIRNTIKKGAIVARRGEEINEDNLPKIQAIATYTNRFNLNAIIGIGILLLLLLYISVILFKGEEVKIDLKTYIVLAGFTLFTVGYAYLITLIKTRPNYLTFGVLVPTAGIIMTADVLFKRKFAFTLAMTIPIFLLLISGLDPYTLLFSMGSGIIAMYAVRDAEKRNDLLKASIFIILANTMMLTAIGLLRELTTKEILTLLIWGAGNGIASVVLSIGVIPFFEVILNLPTNFRLLELSDLNSPILKKMQIEAPGSYNHSLNVANMAEQAARAIRANPLLVRVASLYHDIGKIPNAEYYIENNKGKSKHDLLKPSLSKSILKAHVKIGVEMAREMKLPSEVIDIIEQHHGTSLMKYFYHQALKNKNKDDVDIQEYRYQGPKPQTREAAIVMLADAVEAASRLLRHPSTKRIEEFVTEIVENKFRERELNESSLTLRGLIKISITFRRYLTGVFHTRIEYPDEKEIKELKEDRR